jgi:hypothetical protein
MAIEDRLRGRVMSFYSMMVVGMFPVGSLLAGAVAARAGSRVAVLLGAAGCTFAAWFVFRRQRQWGEWLAASAGRME